MMKPIETRYKGYRFRSRLEARWAVYFDALGIKWDYEKEGYDLGANGWYLPDFWLPEAGVWAEVKPKAFTGEELSKVKGLGDFTKRCVIMLEGPPDFTSYWCYDPIPATDDERASDDVQTYDLAVCWYKDIGRFYCNFGELGLVDLRKYDMEDDVVDGIIASRAARFEHGESG